jgi:hypothetical protein
LGPDPIWLVDRQRHGLDRASVAGAKVQAVNTATSISREATTNERGSYLFSDLQPGTYEVRISATSFATFTQAGIAISANTVVRVDVQMQLSNLGEAVTLVASSSASQTDRSDAGER